jgi:hypothetical protein
VTVAVLGAGLQGCCVALALAERGIHVVLFERHSTILSRTAIANEGKIHLGWMYAADPSLATAKTMMTGALEFGPFLERYLGVAAARFETSVPAAYVVHRDSQHSSDEVRAYFAAVHELLGDASAARPSAYFGQDLARAPREWSAEERSRAFDATHVDAVFDTPEVAIDPVDLARRLGEVIVSHPRIELRLRHEVIAADEASVTAEHDGATGSERFDAVVNALWESRLAIDATAGISAGRPWLYRLKYGIGFTWPSDVPRPPSATIISGPFGEVVSYPDLTTYLTWYPSCVTEMSRALAPPYWPASKEGQLRESMVKGTVDGLAAIVRALAALRGRELEGLWIKGGPIVAWGRTDIDDPRSELHNRYEIGVHSTGNYHSVDPGKLTMAPFFAEDCAKRITSAV